MPYLSEHTSHNSSRVKKSSVTRVLCSTSKKGARYTEPEVADLDAEDSVSERVARRITHQAGSRGCSSPEIRKIRQSPRLSTKSDKSAGSDMRSGSNPPNHTLKAPSVADAVLSPPPEEQTARRRVEARKRRHKKDPKEGKGGKKEPFIIRPTFDAIWR